MAPESDSIVFGPPFRDLNNNVIIRGSLHIAQKDLSVGVIKFY